MTCQLCLLTWLLASTDVVQPARRPPCHSLRPEPGINKGHCGVCCRWACPSKTFEPPADHSHEGGLFHIPAGVQAAALHIDYDIDYDAEGARPPPLDLATLQQSGFAPILTSSQVIVDHIDGSHPSDNIDVTDQRFPRLEDINMLLHSFEGELFTPTTKAIWLLPIFVAGSGII